MPHSIFFISELPPVNSHASSVVFYRHLTKLEAKGFKIYWVTDVNSFNKNKRELPETWQVIKLPNRKFYFPPYRSMGILQNLRFFIYYKFYLKKEIAKTEHPILMTYINGQFLSPLAAYLKIKTRSQLISFFHDDTLELNFQKNRKKIIFNTNRILNASTIVLSVTEELKNNWSVHANKFRLFYPIPENYRLKAKKRFNPQQITIGYSGAIYREIVPYLLLIANILKKTNNNLIIIGNRKYTKHLEQEFFGTVKCLDLFVTAKESNDYLIANCDAMIIPYPDTLETMPWIKSCFPSKFLQYCQLNLPTIILAPNESAISKWCIKNDWSLYSNIYDEDIIRDMIIKITNETLEGTIKPLRDGMFNPDKIQNELEVIIDDLISKK